MSMYSQSMKQNINKSIMMYIVGCCCFASIWFGYHIIQNYGEHDLPIQLTILSLAGCWLLWEIAKATIGKKEEAIQLLMSFVQIEGIHKAAADSLLQKMK